MGLFDFLKSNKPKTKTIRVETAREALDVAQDFCYKKMYDEAIELYRKAYEAMIQTGDNPDVHDYLLLPYCLMRAKRFDEAWGELNFLLTKQISPSPQFYDDYSRIYGAMGSLLIKEKKYSRAISFEMFWKLYYLLYLYKLDLIDLFKKSSSRKNIEQEVKTAMRFTKQEYLIDDITNIMMEAIDKFPKLNISQVGSKINELIFKDEPNNKGRAK